jgi:hypothetical protein
MSIKQALQGILSGASVDEAVCALIEDSYKDAHKRQLKRIGHSVGAGALAGAFAASAARRSHKKLKREPGEKRLAYIKRRIKTTAPSKGHLKSLAKGAVYGALGGSLYGTGRETWRDLKAGNY